MALNPHQKNKVDINSLSPDEQRLFRLYGKLPSRSDHFAKHLKDRKYFDSGDYAMSKAGKGDGVDTGSVGSQHPVPEMIPHLSSPPPAAAPAGSNSGAHNGGHNGVTGGGPGGGSNGTVGANGSGGVSSSSAGAGTGTGTGSIALGIPGAGATLLHHHAHLQQAGSPVKESSFLHNETRASDLDDEDDNGATAAAPAAKPPIGAGQTETMPIRR